MTDGVTPTEALIYYKNAILCSLSTQKWLERNGGTPQEIKDQIDRRKNYQNWQKMVKYHMQTGLPVRECKSMFGIVDNIA